MDVKDIAARTGKRAGYLLDMANPDRHDAAVQVDAMVAVMLVTRNFAPLRFLATECSHAAIQLPELDHVDDFDVYRLFTKTVTELGETSALLQESFADRVLTEAEGRKLADEADQLINQALEYKAAVLKRAGIVETGTVATMRFRA